MEHLAALLGGNNDPLDQGNLTRLYKAFEHATDMLETARSDDRKRRYAADDPADSSSSSSDNDADDEEASAVVLLPEATRRRLEQAIPTFAVGLRQVEDALIAFREARHEMMQHQQERKVERAQRNGRHCVHCPGKRDAPCRCPRECKRSERFSRCTPKTPSAA